MKTERRHELEANELAIRLGKITEAIQPRARAVVAGIVVVVAIVLIIRYTGSASASRKTEAWDRYSAAIMNGDIFELESLGEEYKSESVGSWSRLYLADQYLTTGVIAMFRDRAQANDDIDKAIEHYDAVREQASDELLKQRAHFGLGRAHESLSELAKAGPHYEAIVAGWPNSAMAVAAQNRLDDIALMRTKEFYDWFALQTPQAEFLSNEPGTPGEKPEFNLDFDSPFSSSSGGDIELDFNAPLLDDESSTDTDTDSPGADATDAEPTAESTSDSESTSDADPADDDAVESDAAESDATESDATESDATEPDDTESDDTTESTDDAAAESTESPSN